MPSISDILPPGGKFLKNSEAFLKSQHNRISGINSAEDLVWSETLTEAEKNAIEHHVVTIRAALAKVLWSNEIYVGTSLLDDFVLHQAQTGSDGLVGSVLDALAKAGAERSGFVVYPLINFGMETPGIFERRRSKRFITFGEAGFAACPQSHSFGDAHRKISAMAKALGITSTVELADIEHYAHTATWLTRNPLLLVKLASHTGDMYENQFVYTLKIRLATSMLLMLHAMQQRRRGIVERFKSSAHVNNFGTLDIRHYLIGESACEGRITTRRVPMNVSALDLARLSDVAATISSASLSRGHMKTFGNSVVQAMKIVEKGYLRNVYLGAKQSHQRRLYKRLVTALDWFRQSFGFRANESEAIVALAVAFETLLTDQYARGVDKRIMRRLGICLAGVPGIRAYKRAVLEVYYARGSIVHTGSLGQAANIATAQAAFALCFCNLVSRIPAWTPVPNEPMRSLLGDFGSDK